MDERLRKEFLNGATRAKAAKAFVSGNSENALKTKPKVRDYRRRKVNVMCADEECGLVLRCSQEVWPVATPSGWINNLIRCKPTLGYEWWFQGLFATIRSVSDMLSCFIRGSFIILRSCDRRISRGSIGCWR